MAAPEKLVWFQHMHKCAGTFVVRAAARAGLTFYHPHRNGNPHQDDRLIPLHRFAPDALRAFVDDCLEQGVRFVATEFGAPDIAVLAEHPRVRLLTVLRDPLDRFVSNYRYDVSAGFTSARSVRSYRRSAGDYTYCNYYTNSLARIDPPTDRPSDSQRRRAAEILGRFDGVLVSDEADFNTRVSRFFGTPPSDRSGVNRRKHRSWRVLLGAARRGRWRPLVTAMLADRRVDGAFTEDFLAEAQPDLELYRMAREWRRRDGGPPQSAAVPVAGLSPPTSAAGPSP